MFYFFIISLGLYGLVTITNDNKKGNISSNNSYNNFPSGLELKRQLKNIPIYDYDRYNLKYDLIDEYIFRDYVYNFERNSGYTREVSLRKALEKYIKIYGI